VILCPATCSFTEMVTGVTSNSVGGWPNLPTWETVIPTWETVIPTWETVIKPA
jgi:hypothetical protein